jgi:hypothetical protein
MAHDVMSEVIGQFMRAFALTWHGDATGARRAANAAAEAGAGLLGVFERAIYSAMAVACLADGDAQAAWNAALKAEQGGINPALDGLNMVWMAEAALGFGELAAAERWAYGAASGANASWRAVDLSVRARVNVAKGDAAQGAIDACGSLAGAASSVRICTPLTRSNASPFWPSKQIASAKRAACLGLRTPSETASNWSASRFSMANTKR